MGLTIPYGELATNPAYSAGTTIGDAIRGAGSLACNINKNFPDWANHPIPIVGAYGAGFFNALCGDEPAPPSKPFTGGQCPIRYNVGYTYKIPGNSPVVDSKNNILGPIQGPFSTTPNAGNKKAVAILTGDGQELMLGEIPSSGDDWEQAPTITSVVPVSGGPDNCGDPPPSQPPLVPDAPDLQINAPVYISPTLTLNPTFIYVRPEIDVNVSIPTQVEFKPTIQLPDLNIEIQFGPDNVTVQPYIPPKTNPTPIPPDPRPTPPTPSQPKPPKVDCDCEPCDLTEVIELLEDIKECACEPETTVQISALGFGDSGSYSLPTNTVAIGLQLTAIPSNAKMENGGAGPDVYYAGWVSVGYDNGRDTRLPIAYERNYYSVKNGYTQVSFTCRVGYLATIYAYRLVESTS